jgi:hypothetical protein
MYNLIDRNYDFPNSDPITRWSVLLHRGNMKSIYEMGEEFDFSYDLGVFSSWSERFGCESVYHSHVLWEWIKQM